MIHNIGSYTDHIINVLVYAFISAEDKTFYTNPGFDINSLVKTFLKDIIKIM